MNTKSDLELVDVESVEAVEEQAQIEMSLSDLDMVAGGGVITSFL